MENVAGDGSEADLLRDRLRLAVIKMATAEGRAPLSSSRGLPQHPFGRFLFLMRLTPFLFAQAGRRVWRSPSPLSRASLIWHSRAQVCLHRFTFSCTWSSQMLGLVCFAYYYFTFD
jgi:hypothetical protein